MDGHLWKRAALCSLGLAALFVVGCGGGGGRITAGEACTQLGGAICSREAECDTQVNEATCLTEFQGFCCTGAQCDMEAPNDQVEAELNACTAALDNYDCTAFLAGDLPPACVTETASGALSGVPASRVASGLFPARISGVRQSLDPRVLGRQAGLRLLSR